jgi:DNA-binding protein H-NS
MKAVKFKTMSFDELIKLRDNITGLIARKADSARKELEATLALIENLSVKAVERRKVRGSTLRGKKVAPKYRNPDNPSETWAGRGGTPRWVRDQLKKGRKIEDLAVKKGGRGTAGAKRGRRRKAR